MFQRFDFAFLGHCARNNNIRTKGHPKKIKLMTHANDDDLVLSSSIVPMKVN